MVSIGPYHRSDPNLKAMENQKLAYLKQVLHRTCEITSLEMYVEALQKLEPEVRKCYSEPINLNSEQFIEMMLIDGFFIVELFRKNSKDVLIEENDPIFYFSSRVARVMRDLILLENQIPMSVLQTLFDLSENPKSGSSFALIQMALNFFNTLIPNGINKYPQEKNTVTHNHLVDLLCYTLSVYLPKPLIMPALSSAPTLSSAQESLPPVMELQCSGVQFKMGGKSDSLIHIKFDKGVFEIPQLCITDHTNSFFRNLIAYEQCHYRGIPYITSYAILMDYLIDSADDVALLRRHKIIINQLGNDEKVSSLFNDLCHGISTNGFYYNDLCNKVDGYYKSPYHQWKAQIKHTLSSNFISVVAAILLLLLTVWSTVIITLPFFNVVHL
ncbi:hypothetical protein NE237_027625 [Protea cynaroides]|uniref:Uncharacterized protein n=1 Tax=Protea cynaroides TaxID=273540 RepID=A0A9Q0JUK0_9MAGN|nr:hypothetical protein NE237_027625 [Protea cynaroides]